jgi:hypothetical protein
VHSTGRLPVFPLLFALSKSLIPHADCRPFSIVSLFSLKISLFSAEKQGTRLGAHPCGETQKQGTDWLLEEIRA